MNINTSEWVWINDHDICSASQLIAESGLSEGEFDELVACGVINPVDHGAGSTLFKISFITTAHTARRLRDDFELDLHGLALAMTLKQRIEALEKQLLTLHAQLGNAGTLPAE
jgi:chaperone modulatory protein CbpM